MNKLYWIFSIAAIVFLSFSFKNSKKIVIIDAGHGGIDKGATTQGVSEKDITLAIATKIKSLQKNNDVEIILTREGDVFPSLAERAKFISSSQPTYVISLHANFNPKNKEQSGKEVYYKSNEASKNLAHQFSEKFNFCPVSEKPLYLLKNTSAPTVLLELGFLSNDKDRENLSSVHGQTLLAQQILDIINK